MRLITRKIYRAFPELDRFSNEQCTRFVRAARRGFRRRFTIFALCSVAALATLIVPSLLWALILSTAGIPAGEGMGAGRWHYGGVAVLLLSACAAPIAGFVVRDRLLIRRIRYVVRTRGLCSTCRYNLVGLPVGPNNKVTCPECAAQTAVDPSLGELSSSREGRTVFEVSDETAPVLPPFWTPKRKRFFKRLAIAATILLFGVFPALWGSYEIFLYRQAAVARRERPGREGLFAIVESAQPPGAGPATPDAWDSFATAAAIVEAADQRTWKNGQSEPVDGAELFPDFAGILAPPATQLENGRENYNRRCVELALQMLDQYRADGLHTHFTEMNAHKRSALGFQLPSDGPMIGCTLPELGKARSFARINAARMRLATKNGDLNEFADAFEANLALVRMTKTAPFVISSLVGVAIQSLALERLEELLNTHPDKQWIAAIRERLERQRFTLDPAYPFQSERVMTLDSVAWMFSEPSRVRFGQFSKGLAPYLGEINFTRRLGTYAGNRDAIDLLYKDAFARARSPEYFRPPMAPDNTSLMLVEEFMPAFGRALSALDRGSWQRVEVDIRLALEAWHADHADYPQHLSQLIPDYLAAIPTDPRTAKPVLYVRLDPATSFNKSAYELLPDLESSAATPASGETSPVSRESP